MERRCLIWFLIVLLAMAFEARAVLKGSYDDCRPTNCRNDGPNISYPFYSSGNEFCGYPGFEIECKENGTTSFDGYVVQHISYGDRSFNVINRDAIDNVCIPHEPKQHYNILDNIFIRRRTNDSLCFFYNCTNPSSGRPKPIKSCQSNDTLVMLVDPNHNQEDKKLQCKWAEILPVDLREGDRNNTEKLDYGRLLEDGVTLDWGSLLTVSSCDGCQQSSGRCGRSESGDFECFCPDGTSHPDNCTHAGIRWQRSKVGLGIAVGGVLIATSLIAMASYGIFKKCWPMTPKNQNGNRQRDIEALMGSNGSVFWPGRYKYSDLKKLTNSFSEKLGEGGYGEVYKGQLREDNIFVAVKILKECKGDGEEFINEVASISRTAHVNIVQLLGFSYEGNKRALLYEYMPNGSLDKFLPRPMKGSPDCPLGWKTLQRIAIGVARGLEYLHQGCNTRILHFDIKPQNILLDRDFTPKISDFGLAKLCKGGESIVSMIGTRGTIGYIAPEVFSRCFGSVSNKSDVYSYGMLVFEMIGGKNKSNVEASRSSEMYFPEWVYNHLESGRALWIPGIDSEDDEETARKMMLVSLWCIQPNPSDRPSMSRVIEMMEGSIQLVEVPPKPFLKSPSRLQSLKGSQTTASTTWSWSEVRGERMRRPCSRELM